MLRSQRKSGMFYYLQRSSIIGAIDYPIVKNKELLIKHEAL